MNASKGSGAVKCTCYNATRTLYDYASSENAMICSCYVSVPRIRFIKCVKRRDELVLRGVKRWERRCGVCDWKTSVAEYRIQPNCDTVPLGVLYCDFGSKDPVGTTSTLEGLSSSLLLGIV